MPTPTFTPGDNKQDERLNPGDQDYNRRFNEGDFENRINNTPSQDDVRRGLGEAEAAANKNQQSSDGSIGDLERNTENKKPAVSTIKSTYTGVKAGLKGKISIKKGSTLTSIIVILLGAMGLLGTLFTPGLGVIQMKEVLTGDLNDQLAAMDIRSTHVFRAKLKNMSTGFCTGVQIKCKFTSMNTKQIDRFKKAGFVIADDGVKETLFGRKIITSMTAPNGAVITNPADLTKAFNESADVRSAMKRVFNPLYYGLSDKVANAFFTKNKTNKQKKVTGANEDERKKNLTNITAGEKVGTGGALKTADGRQYIFDETGTQVFQDKDPDKFNTLKADAEARVSPLATLSEGTKATGKVFGGAVKGLSVTGIADSACTVYNTARAVSAGAKIARSMQLIQFAMVIASTADSIKAGDATPEEVEFIGKKLTATDSQEMVTNETSGLNAQSKNPMYGKSAFDSAGYKTAAYNEAPLLTSRSQQYMVGGGLSGTLSGVLKDVTSLLPGSSPAAIRQGCGVVQSPWVRGAGLIVGIFTAIGSFGVTTAISIGGSVAISFALPFLEAMLADIVAGNAVSGDTAGVDAGDAAFAGTAAMLGGISQNRGMTPMSKEGIQEYTAAIADTKSDMIALEKYEASKDPLNVMNQYSFLGTFARSLYPTSIVAKSSLSGALTSIGSVVTQGFASLTQPVSAVTTYNADRYTKCNDPGYEELGIDADVFCNVRYGLTSTELALDTEVVVDFMIANGYVSNSGAPQGDYEKFMEICANREDGWGEASEEGGSIGLECLDGTGSTFKNISYFRVYTMDKSISDAMDDEVEQEGSTELVGKPDGAIDSERGWRLANGVDYSKYECDSRTTEDSIYTDPNYGYTVRLCKVDFNGTGIIASVISTNVMNMFEDAKKAGVELGITDGMRKAGGANYSSYTEHKYGVAMDIGTPRSGQTICYGGDPRFGYGSAENAERACRARGGIHYAAYQWLQKNAESYGIYNYLVEPWHWSSSGK